MLRTGFWYVAVGIRITPYPRTDPYADFPHTALASGSNAHTAQGSVRFPAFVHHRLVSLDLPMRSESGCSDEPRISQLPRKMCACVPGSKTAQDSGTARANALPGCSLPPRVKTSASWSLGYFAADSPWPVVSPVNASYLALRPGPHDSEPVWFACPSAYDSFIRYILPVWRIVLPEGYRYCYRRCGASHGLALRHVTPGWVTRINICSNNC